jgi:hypothetical protein
MLPAKFGSIWPSSFRGEDFSNISQSETGSIRPTNMAAVAKNRTYGKIAYFW